MGIYDRDYIRYRDRETPGSHRRGFPSSETPRAGAGWLAAMRMWSVTTWLIIACVTAFVVDFHLVPKRFWRPVLVSADVPPYVEQVGGDQFIQVPMSPPGADAMDWRAITFTRKIYDISTISREHPQPDFVGTFVYQWMPPLTRWLHFSTALAVRKVEVWRLIGFQFLHASWLHLLVNMVALYFFGPLVERSLGAKRYLAFYLLCGICGALMYLVLNLGGYVVALYTHGPVAIPLLFFNSLYQPLVGASAGIFGVLMAGAYLAPDEEVILFFVLPMRLVTMAYALVILALITVAFGGPNAGGEAGHLGGAAAGYYLIRHPHHLHGFFDFLGWVDPTSHHYRRGGRTRRASEVDRVLAKVSASGLDSLTEREKRILREAAERK